jgi:hypothetical protein
MPKPLYLRWAYEYPPVDLSLAQRARRINVHQQKTVNFVTWKFMVFCSGSWAASPSVLEVAGGGLRDPSPAKQKINKKK